MPIPVSDFRSNVNDQLAHAARTIGSGTKRQVFEAVYRGRAAAKSVGEIGASTGLTRKQVLTAGLALAKTGLVEQVTRNGDLAYQKDITLSHYRDNILSLAADPAKLRRLPTKTSPNSSTEKVVSISIQRDMVNIREISVDDIDSFAEVKNVDRVDGYVRLPEQEFKNGIRWILGELGDFRDWGGEINDLFTGTLVLSGHRTTAAFAFKGPGTTGILTPKKMGTNGDQIARLFQSPATVYLVQYWGQVHQQVYADMRTYAIAKSVLRAGAEQIAYGVIGGVDSARLLSAYPQAFNIVVPTAPREGR